MADIYFSWIFYCLPMFSTF